MVMRMKISPRTVLIGLDGVPHSLLLDLKKSGCIPNIAKILQNGFLGRMEVCIPEISSVSWTSFMTGKQPGEHGIYGFMDLKPGSYDLFFPNYTHLRVGTLWDDLATQCKQSVVINMPATYPARSINGALISGFVAIDLDKAVYPVSLAPYLRRLNYRIDIDTARARTDHSFLFRDLEETLDTRRRAVEYLWETIDWDMFCVVITGTDRLMHFLWTAYEDRSHPQHADFLNYFRTVDAFIGSIYERFTALDGYDPIPDKFYMISDHGFTAITSEVYLNAWLEQNNYLRFQRTPPRSIMDIGPGSKAFALDPSRIYINLKEKYPLGCVDGKDYEEIRHHIAQGLSNLTFDDGRPVMRKVYFKEELYFGPCLETAPDLVALSNHGFDLKGKVSSRTVFGKSDLSGMHTQDDAFFYSSSGAPCGSIYDAGKILFNGFFEPENEIKGPSLGT
jgi:predicted AlkP superfamily phosphohydrolase/phosphomutase